MTKKEIGHNKNSELKKLEEKIAELTNGWQRAQADFLNYKKQAAEDKINFCKNANTELIYELLPVLDNFQRAATHAPEELENDNWAIGIKHIEKQLENILSENGLEKIESKGQQFNPHYHEAIEHVESDKPEGEIVEEILAGYKFNDSIIRPAKVKVSNGNFHGERSEA
jgi:molecular chaperone GrpE